MRWISLCSAALMLAACGREFPRDIYLDARFSKAEVAEIKEAIAEVNKLGRLIGEERLIEVAGRFKDDDGRFGQDNVDNDDDELYRIGSPGECWDFVEDFQDEFGDIGNLNGFYTGTDVGILIFNLNRPDRPTTRYVAMHELGHFVGMHHVIGNSWAVMAPSGYGPQAFTSADKEEFCLQHGCDPD